MGGAGATSARCDCTCHALEADASGIEIRRNVDKAAAVAVGGGCRQVTGVPRKRMV